MASTLSLLLLVLCASQINCSQSDSDLQVLDDLKATVQSVLDELESIKSNPLDAINKLIATVTALGDKECAIAIKEELTQVQNTLVPKILDCGKTEIDAIKSILESVLQSIDAATKGIKEGDLTPLNAAVENITKQVVLLSKNATKATDSVTTCVTDVVGKTLDNLKEKVTTCLAA